MQVETIFAIADNFGIFSRADRKDAGFSSVERFIESVETETGCRIAKDTMYRIESGKAQPTLMQAMAISATLDRNLGKESRITRMIAEGLRPV